MLLAGEEDDMWELGQDVDNEAELCGADADTQTNDEWYGRV